MMANNNNTFLGGIYYAFGFTVYNCTQRAQAGCVQCNDDTNDTCLLPCDQLYSREWIFSKTIL